MATRIMLALLFGVPALLRLWYYRDSITAFALPVVGISLALLVIAAGLLMRKPVVYHAARVALWVMIGLVVLSFSLVPFIDAESLFNELFLPRAVGSSLLTILFAVWLLVMLGREKVKKDFGIE